MFKLIKNGSVYAPDELGVKDILVCGEKILRIVMKSRRPVATKPRLLMLQVRSSTRVLLMDMFTS